nr:ESPR-type extended signal peptide-containing protein [Bibersteinia trehalosi]
MNRIFKVIWSHATRTFVVVSELARNGGKVASQTNQVVEISNIQRKSGLKLSLLSIAVALGTVSNAHAAVAIQSLTSTNISYNDSKASTPGQLTYAYNYYNPGSKSYKDATMNEGTGNRYAEVDSTGITIGVNTSAIGKRNQFANGIAIGDHAQATGGLAVSIGHLSQALDIGSVALGTSSRAVGFNSLAAMRQSVAVGDFAIAIGSTAWADSNHSLAIGSSATAKGRQSFAIGSADYVATEDNSDSSEARRSKYDGMNNTQTNGNRSFAIGSSAKTNGDNSFAFGSDANTGSFDKVTDTYLNADVSKANTSKQARNAFALGTTARALDGDAFAIGTAAQASNNSSFAIGTQAKASDKNAFALGTTANASGQNSVAFGVLSNATHTDSIAFGVQSKSFNNKAIALGTESLSNGTAAVSVGSSSKASGERSISIGADANVSQKSGGSIAIGENATVDAKESTAVGMQSKALSNFSTSIGASSRVAENAESGMAIGHTANVTAANATAIGTNAVASHKNAVALGQGAVTREATSENTTTVNGITYSGFAGNNPSSVVSVGNATSGEVRQIVNVAAGNISKDSTDAINGSQLYLVAVEAGKKSFVKAGTNTEVKTTAHANGSVTYTVDAMKTIADKGSDYITVTSSNEGNNTLKYTIDLNQTAKDAINQVANNTQNITNINNTIKQGWNITTTESNGGKVTGSSTANVQLGELVTIDAGQNINITQADRKISIATSLDPKFNSVTTNNFTVNASGVVNMGGNTVQNVANGTNATDAVNLQQLNASKSVVKAGNYTNVTSSSDANGTVYTVNADKSVVKAGTNVNVTTDTDGKGLTNYTVKVDGDLTNITSITNNVGNKLTIGNGTTTVEGGKAKVSNNSNKTDIATVGDIVNTINNVSWAVAGNGAVQENITAGEVVNFANGNNSVAVVTANKTTGGVDVKFNVEGDLKNISSLTNNGTTITIGDTNNNKVVNVNGANITNVANGTNATDAVNLQQLNASKSVVKAGNYTNVTSTSDANGTVYTVNAEKSVVTEGTNVKVNVTTSGDGLTTYNVSVAGDLTNITSITNNVGNKLTIGNGTTTVEGGKAKVSDNSNATDIATVGDIVKTINNVSWTVSGNGEVKENITAGEVVNFVNGNNSVAVVTANNTTGGVDVKFNVEGALSNITSLTNNGTTITIGDANNNKVVNVNGANITNVANGTNATDAVNLQQLNASKSVVKAGNYTTVTSTSDANGTVYTVNAEKSVVKAGNNVNVTTETDGKGLTNYTVKVEGDLTNISSITNNGTTIKLDNQNGNKTVDVGGATITNVAAGVNLTDAVNVGQLEKVNATANAGWNVTTNNGNQTYNVKPNATVDLSSSDGNIVIGQKDGNITFALAGNLSNITNISNGDNNSIRLGDNNNITTIISNGTTFTFGAGNTTVNVSGKAELVTGTNSTDVATVGDIIETINGVSWTLAGNGANVSQIKAGDIVNFVDGKNTKASAKVNNGATEVTYNVEGDLTNITSITNNGTTIKLENKDGDKAINVDGATITNVKAGENGTDAVNLDQLNASKSVVKAGNYTTVTSTSDANGTVYTVNAEKSVVVAGTNANVTTTTDGKGLTTYNVSVTGDLTKHYQHYKIMKVNKLTLVTALHSLMQVKQKLAIIQMQQIIATVGDYCEYHQQCKLGCSRQWCCKRKYYRR